MIARLWQAHHRLLEHVETYDGVVVQVSLAWALSIVVLPFPTRLIAVYSNDRLAIGLYIGCLLISAPCLAVLAVHVRSTPALRAVGPAPRASSDVATAGLLALSLAVVLVVPRFGNTSLLLLLLSRPAVLLRERRGTWWRRVSAGRA